VVRSAERSQGKTGNLDEGCLEGPPSKTSISPAGRPTRRRAGPTDILHFPARVVVTPADAPIVFEQLTGVRETADDQVHADHGPSAAALRPPPVVHRTGDVAVDTDLGIPVRAELTDLQHFVDFARRVPNSQSLTKAIRTNSDGGHSAGPEALARIPRRSTGLLRDGTHVSPVATVPSCPAAGIAQIRQAAMGVW
jgi:hypothetical protein